MNKPTTSVPRDRYRPRDFWESMTMESPEYWQHLLGTLGDYGQRLDEPLKTRKALRDVVAHIKAVDETLWRQVEDAINNFATEQRDWAVVFGYGLAKTWPDGPEGFDTWAARAIEYARPGWHTGGDDA